MESVELGSPLPLQFAVGILHGHLPSSNTPVEDAKSVLESVIDHLLTLPSPQLKEANGFLQSAVDQLRRDPHGRAAGDDLKEAKEYALDEFVTGLSDEVKLDLIKYVVVVEILLFFNSFPRCRSIQERIRCIQTTRRVCNVHLKKLNEIRGMLLFLVDKLCRHEGVGKSETWMKEGVELEDDAEPDPVVEASKIAFFKSVYVINVQTHSFLDFVQSDFIAKSPGLVADVVGPVQCESLLKINVTTWKIDDVMMALFKATKNEDIRIMMGYEPI